MDSEIRLLKSKSGKTQLPRISRYQQEKWYTLVTPKGREYLAAEAGKVCAICVHPLPLATARA